MFRFTKALAAISIATIAALAVCATGSPVHAQSATVGLTPRTIPQVTYVVRSGDSLFSVAAKLGVRLGPLLRLNHLTLTSVIHPGTVLLVPAEATNPVPTASNATTTPTTTPSTTPSTTPASTPASTTYVVKSGDYLISIALRHGVRLSALLNANKLVVTSAIHPGNTLIIPPATMAIPAAPTSKTSPPTVAPVGTTTTTPAIPSTTSVPAQGPLSDGQKSSIAKVLSYLQAQIGKPYLFNSAGPDSFDCSGLTLAAYAQIGVKLPHQSLLQSQYGVAVDWTTAPILPGDLVFMYSSSNPTQIGHVGVVVDSKTWIQSARTGTPVRIGPMPSSERIKAVRRLVQG